MLKKLVLFTTDAALNKARVFALYKSSPVGKIKVCNAGRQEPTRVEILTVLYAFISCKN
jgi:hypothetical protein